MGSGGDRFSILYEGTAWDGGSPTPCNLSYEQ